MRALYIGIPAILLASGQAAAQSATEGPLAKPDAAIVAPAPALKKTTAHKPAKHAGDKAKSAHATNAKTAHAKSAGFDAEGHPNAEPILHAPDAAPADPLSFGMKWNGANDDARGTRVQNYDGNAQGTGAEVGMRLHF